LLRGPLHGTGGFVRWFSVNPVMMGCLVPIVLFAFVFVVRAVITAVTFRSSWATVGFLVAAILTLLPVVWALVVWARWFGRRS